MFWDLYCAAPERRDTCEHSSEAKAFHDYVSIAVTSVRSHGSILGSVCGNVAFSERSTRYIGPVRSCTCLRISKVCLICCLMLIYNELCAFVTAASV